MPDKRDPNAKTKSPIYVNDPLTERIRKIQELIKFKHYLGLDDDYDDYDY